jgi:hypothetical protein
MKERVAPKDPQVEIITQMADSFFMSKGRPSEEPLMTSNDVLGVDFDSDLNPNTINVSADEKPWDANLDAALMEPEDDNLDAPQMGGHLDVVV